MVIIVKKKKKQWITVSLIDRDVSHALTKKTHSVHRFSSIFQNSQCASIKIKKSQWFILQERYNFYINTNI